MQDKDTLRTRLKQTKHRADMQISGHNRLSDSLRARAQLSSLIVLTSAVFLLMFAWVQESWIATLASLVRIQLNVDTIKFFLGVAAFLNFSLVLWDLVAEPRTRSELHSKAVEHLTKVKHNIQRVLDSETEITNQIYQELIDEYLDCPVKFADKDFLNVKKYHLVKKDLSKLLDEHPHACLPVVRLKIWWRDTQAAMSARTETVDKSNNLASLEKSD